MALSDITPAQILGETNQAKLTASAIFTLAAYLDQHAEAVWDQYGRAWPNMTTAQKNAVITELAGLAGVTVSTTLLTWIRSFIDLLVGDRYTTALLAKLRADETRLVAELAAVRAKIAELEG
jgi:hypothetical protein